MKPTIDPDDYDYLVSAIGNGIWSGLTPPEIWSCIRLSNTGAEVDAAISLTIKLKELCNERT